MDNKYQLSPMRFPEANRDLMKPESMTDEECGSLCVYTDGKICISCWKLNLRQRLAALFTGKVWLGILSGYTQPPVWLDVGKTVFIEVRQDE